MNIVKPSVELLGVLLPARLTEDGRLEVRSTVPEKLIEEAGRTCYKSEDRITDNSYKPFVKKINVLGHESVYEHSGVTIRVICDRGVSHEAVRHRLAAYSQESTRYCNYLKEKFGSEITVIEPPGLTKRQRIVWAWAMRQLERCYSLLIRLGASPQIARSVLPNSLKTEIVWTANFREWKHVIRMRTSPKAHPQMIEVATMIEQILQKVAPEIFAKGIP